MGDADVIVCPNYSLITYIAKLSGVHGVVGGEVTYTIEVDKDQIEANLTALLNDSNKTFIADDN